MKIVDVHVHVFPELIFRRIWKYFIVHYWVPVYAWSEEKRAEFFREKKVLYTTLVYAHKPGLAAFLNEYVLNYSCKNPEAIPVGTFHPEDEDLMDYVERSIEKGIKGFKIHIEVQGFDPAHSRLKDVYRLMSENELVLHIHTARTPLNLPWTGFEHFKRLLKVAPELKIVVAHGGIPEFKEYFSASCHHPVYFDTAMVGVKFPDLWKTDEAFLDAVQLFPEKFLFGSDFPNIPYQWEHQIETVRSWGLDDEHLKLIFYGNAVKLYNLNTREGS